MQTRPKSAVQQRITRVLGHHLIVDMWECAPESLTSVAGVESALRDAVAACRATLIELRVHAFQPTGVTGVAIIKESHISVHTWPELGYAAVDIFTCGETDAHSAVGVLNDFFSPRRSDVMEFKRGAIRS